MLLLAGLAAAGLLAAQPSITSQYTYQVIDYPHALATFPLGINDQRMITGFFIDAAGVNHGFLWKAGKFLRVVDYPGSGQFPGGGTITGGINNRGDVVGTYAAPDGHQHGFKMTRPDECEDDDGHACNPAFTEIDVPGAVLTSGVDFEFGPGLGSAAIGISNSGTITGMYATSGLYANAFFLAGGHYHPLDSPAASHLPGDGTKCFSVNTSGAAACDYLVQSSSAAPQFTHGFLYEEGGKMTPIFVPGSEAGGFGTQVNGVNDAKKVVGTFTIPSGALAGLVWFRGDYFTLNYPAMPFTELHSINNRGEITGAYATDPFGQFEHGFLAIPK